MFPANFAYVAARSVNEALELMAQHGEDGKLLAGGHSLIPAMKLRLSSPRTLIDLGTVPGLRGIKIDAGNLVIGALDGARRYRFIGSGAQARARSGRRRSRSSAIMQVRNRGTIGGSVAHADPGRGFSGYL